MSAMVRVRIARDRRSRAKARKVHMDPDDSYYYCFSSDGARNTHHFVSSTFQWSLSTAATPTVDHVQWGSDH